MNLIEELDAEVNSLAENMTVEVVLALIDKWDAEIEMAWKDAKASLPDLLYHYVRLKISLHHVRRAWDRGWSSMSEDVFKLRAGVLSDKIREARRKYYVAKQRYEGQHGGECSCRGCRAIEDGKRYSPEQAPGCSC